MYYQPDNTFLRGSLKMDTDCFKYYLFSLSSLFGIIYSSTARGTSYTNCLTWQDDQDGLQLICRVSDYITPVIFYHNESKTEVICQIRKDERGCTFNVETFSIDEYKNTLTVILNEKKDGRHLDGEWYCKQGDSIQHTNISLSDGIINDPSIYIRGTVENTSQNLTVECSSCQKPHGPYVEISINGKTEATLHQSEEGCFYKLNTPCSNVCNCTETQNAFSLRLQLPNTSISTNISCDMQFVDAFRGTTFGVSVSHAFDGKDFKKTGKKITIRSRPNYPPTTAAAVESSPSNPKVTIPNVKTTWWIDNSNIVIAVVTSVLITAILSGLLLCILFKPGKCIKKQKNEEVESESTRLQDRFTLLEKRFDEIQKLIPRPDTSRENKTEEVIIKQLENHDNTISSLSSVQISVENHNVAEEKNSKEKGLNIKVETQDETSSSNKSEKAVKKLIGNFKKAEQFDDSTDEDNDEHILPVTDFIKKFESFYGKQPQPEKTNKRYSIDDKTDETELNNLSRRDSLNIL